MPYLWSLNFKLTEPMSKGKCDELRIYGTKKVQFCQITGMNFSFRRW